MNESIITAVKHLKGEWHYADDTRLINNEGFGYIYKNEFNECVKELSGDPVKLAEWLAKKSATNKPLIYTQKMADQGELPIVGMVCKVNGNTRVILLTADSDGDYVTMNDQGSYDFYSISYIKPIDTRTDKEKADDLFKFYLKGESVSTHKSFSQAVIDGDFGDNIKWVK